MAVPMTVKIPEPITAPTPNAVRETGPSVFRRECSGRSDSEISLSIDLVAKICRPSERLLKRGFFPRHSRRDLATADPIPGPQLYRLPLRLTATRLLYLGFVFAAGSGSLGLGRGLFASCPLDLLALFLVSNALGIRHGSVVLSSKGVRTWVLKRRCYSFSSCANFSTSFFTPCC